LAERARERNAERRQGGKVRASRGGKNRGGFLPKPLGLDHKKYPHNTHTHTHDTTSGRQSTDVLPVLLPGRDVRNRKRRMNTDPTGGKLNPLRTYVARVSARDPGGGGASALTSGASARTLLMLRNNRGVVASKASVIGLKE